ncbi:uncharacterized protein LOC115979232 [Quercus lobata]|uniref:uncharacterized protein LOC115979232 n=1 Tax=Quercus lobata TaxID=97700 RepID=UPI001247E29C|nr:uncharacterized protein LOC115979232 [Quercus lobata]
MRMKMAMTCSSSKKNSVPVTLTHVLINQLCLNYQPRRKNLAIKRAAAAAQKKKSLAAVSEISDDDEDFELEVVAVLQKLGKSEKDEGISIQQEKWFGVGQGW